MEKSEKRIEKALTKTDESDLRKFVDANVFIHAYLKPKRRLTTAELAIKSSAKSIVSRINDGEPVIISVVHLSEIFNLLEDNLMFEDAVAIERTICFKQNIEVVSVSQFDYLEALERVDSGHTGVNDNLAYVLMKKNQIRELYSFDKDFDRFPDIKRVSS